MTNTGVPEPAGTCRLCGIQAPLVNSHLIPAFVTRWLRDTSATGFMRRFVEPNLRVQDLERGPLLCAKCDNERLAPREDAFGRCVFFPYHSGASTFEYQGWLPYFAVSLAWRCLQTLEPNTDQDWPQHVEALARAERSWRAFLLSETATLAPYEHHLFFTSLGAEGTRVPEELGWYQMRACDMTTVFGQRLAATYVSLPGMFFWAYVSPTPPGVPGRLLAHALRLRRRGVWKGTRIVERGTIRAWRQSINDAGFAGFYFDRVRMVGAIDLSPRQKERLEESIRSDPERVLRSRSLQTSLDKERIKRSKG